MPEDRPGTEERENCTCEGRQTYCPYCSQQHAKTQREIVEEIQAANSRTAVLLGWNEDAPYPWCYGSPTVQDCVKRGYCNRDPNCGE